ncbi:MAG: hypothetical protein SYNGOMJ08_00601 [Candidatus Syntrophoarchaeum sp. GoM_oil]|nr:MAG: hypothetical protein SYNGOMJ08_00601 [Candidatus Syntrophoarchaeum sp. GoM_oil]
MPKEKIHFMGILANVDSSILNVKLDHGFVIEAQSENELVNLIANFDEISPRRASEKLYMQVPCLNADEKAGYVIKNSFEVDKRNNKSSISFSDSADFNTIFVHEYLDNQIRLMLLFREGNIRMPIRYYYKVEDGTPKLLGWLGTVLHVLTYPKYKLEEFEISDLQKFIQKTELPFSEDFLQFAFENFELSYQIHNASLSFLSLMNGLESLFNPSDGELRYRISRNTAAFLGKDKEDSKKISKDIRDLYDKRSKIVHTGKSNVVDREDVLKLRDYVRESIKEINKIGKNKDELLDMLTSTGFGGWEKIDRNGGVP